jgi:hypothetical protein
VKYVFNFFAILLISWPGIVVGYIVGAAVSGYKVGRFLYDQGEDAAIEKFTAKRKE